MKKTAIFLLSIASLIFSLLQPTLASVSAQQDVESRLAGSAVRGFLRALGHPGLSNLLDFYLLDSLNADDILADFQDINSYKIEQAGWLTPGETYQLTAVLEPGMRRILIQAGKHNDRWQVESIEEATSSLTDKATPSSTELRPVAGNGAGQLVFQTHSGGDIYLINADGTGLKRITHGLDPQLSPDGSQITLTRWEPDYALYTVNVDGSDETVWASGQMLMKSPTWSADGSRIIFSYRTFYDAGKRVKLNLYNLTAPPNIPPNARDLVFNPDGTIAYSIPPDAHWTLAEVDLASAKLQDLRTDTLYNYAPVAHPSDPNQLLFRGDKGIASLNLKSQTSQPISFDDRDRGALSISPDGTKIALSYWQDGHWEIHTMNIDGSHRKRLTETPLSEIVQKSRSQAMVNTQGFLSLIATETGDTPNPNWNNAAPAWSADGSQIAFLTDRTGQWEIWLMNADGSNQRPMFPNGALDDLTFNFSGDDERMIFWQ